MKSIPITKYHELGNDFIITRYSYVENEDIVSFIRSVCDRHTGIGADGAIFVKTNPLEMVYYNQDGSRAPMCGNGIRCFAKYCFDENIDRSEKLVVQTLAGKKVVYRQSEDPFLVRVDMGYAEEYKDKWPIQIGPHTCYSGFVSTVHTVLFEPWDQTVGHDICHDPNYPEQTNVNFVQIQDPTHLSIRTYERGCGPTLACGTGVCASVYTAYTLGKCANSVDVQLIKGQLHIDIDPDGRIFMTGPAQKILEGETA